MFDFNTVEDKAVLREWFTGDLYNHFLMKSEYVINRGFTVVTQENLQTLVLLARDHNVLNLSCGTGYLAYHLERNGVSITAVDEHPMSSRFGLEKGPYTNKIIKCDYNSINLSLFDLFLITCPDYEKITLDDVVKDIAVGSVVIYNGEWKEGEDNGFYKTLIERFVVITEPTNKLNTNHVCFKGSRDIWLVLKKIR